MSTTDSPAPPPESPVKGVAAALGAYGIWSVFPLIFHAVAEVPVLEILSHRILWAAVAMVLLLWFRGQLTGALAVLGDRKATRAMALSTLLISINWVTYIFAVVHGQTLQASLGYYILPLLTVLLARAILGEAISKRQGLALGLAALGVGIAVVGSGGFPWIALTVALSFSLYGLVRKTAPVGALEGLTIETLMISPFLLGYLVWAQAFGPGTAMVDGPWPRTLLLFALGPLTALPLGLFAIGARRLRLSTLGILQYSNPTIQFALAVWVLGEPLNPASLATFACIWCAVAVYLWPARTRSAPDTN
jgi:chloramphenicol-sensitive protein RarD